jgi:ABC-type multidrug transport system fused ATPase/permease subunit
VRVPFRSSDRSPADRRGSGSWRAVALLRGLFAPAVAGDGIVATAPGVPVRTLFRRFWPFARPLRAALIAGVLVLVAVPAVEAAQVWLFKVLVDEALVPADLGPLGWIALAYLGLFLVGAVLAFANDYLGAWVGERFILAVRRRLYSHLLRQSPDVLDRRRLGDVLARVTGDVQTIESFLLAGLGDGVSALARITFFTAALFYLSWELALASLIVGPLFWLSARRFSSLIRDSAREKRRRAGSLGAVAEEGLANAALVQTSNQHDAELRRFERESEGMMRAELAATRLRALFAPIAELIELAGVLLVLAWGTWALSSGDLTLGGLLAFLTYLGLLYRPARDLGEIATSVFEASAAAERVLELIDREPLVLERPGAKRLGRARGELELDDVWVRYRGADTPALADVSLHVAAGETLLVTGPSGAGKSTLARLLVRLYDPDAGAVRLDGVDLDDLTLGSVRANVGALLQEQLLFDATLRENVAYGCPGASEEEILAVCRATGVDDVAARLPNGDGTPVGQRGRALSGGQRQRVALARTLLRDTPVVVLDEPFTGLDDAGARRLLPALEAFCRDRTTILISHHPIAAVLADRAVEVRGGRLSPLPLEVAA